MDNQPTNNYQPNQTPQSGYRPAGPPPSPPEPPAPPRKRNTGAIVALTAVVSALIAGMLVYIWATNTAATSSQSTNDQIAALKSQNAALQTQVNTLTQQNKTLTAELAKYTKTTPTPTPVPTARPTTTPVVSPTPAQ